MKNDKDAMNFVFEGSVCNYINSYRTDNNPLILTRK